MLSCSEEGKAAEQCIYHDGTSALLYKKATYKNFEYQSNWKGNLKIEKFIDNNETLQADVNRMEKEADDGAKQYIYELFRHMVC